MVIVLFHCSHIITGLIKMDGWSCMMKDGLVRIFWSCKGYSYEEVFYIDWACHSGEFWVKLLSRGKYFTVSLDRRTTLHRSG